MGRRVAWIDTAKGLLICLVVLGHLVLSDPEMRGVYRFIYSFLMPAFFFLSGILLKHLSAEGIGVFLKKRAKWLMVPYVAFLVLGAVNMLFAGTGFPAQPKLWVNTALLDRKSIFQQYWFLPALLSAECVMYILRKMRWGYSLPV